MENTSIIACGKQFDIGCRVINWDESNGFSFYKNGKMLNRSLAFNDLEKILTCLVFHHAASYTAKSTYDALCSRKLSCTFIIDDNISADGVATIYQCADIEESCFSHNYMNAYGSGVEIAYMPEAWVSPQLYSKYSIERYNVQPHKVVSDTIRGYEFGKVFAPTEAQVAACARLAWGYTNLFPNIKPEFPRDNTGKIIKNTLKDAKTHKGLLQHYHISSQKIDALGFPMEELESKVRELNIVTTALKTKPPFLANMIKAIRNWKTK